MGKRTFQNCRFYRSGDVLFADMEVFKGQGNDTEVLRLIGMISILSDLRMNVDDFNIVIVKQ